MSLPEPLLYHDVTAQGWFSVLTDGRRSGDKPRYRTYHLAEMPSVINSFPTNTTVFLSQAGFRQKYPQRIVTLNRLGLVFADLDIHKTHYGDMTPQQQARAVCIFCEDHALPVPSLINFSGRGLHCKWLIDPITADALPRWVAVTRELCNRLQELGSDPNALNPTQMLRAVGTLNKKSGAMCRTVYQNGTRWDFDILCDEILPFTREEYHTHTRQIEAEKAARRKTYTPKDRDAAANANLWTRQQLWWERLADVRLLIELRGWTRGVPEGSRTNFLYVAASAMAWLVDDPTLLRDEIDAIAQEFVPSFSPADVRSYTTTVYQRGITKTSKHITSENLIRRLRVTHDEQVRLKTIICNDLRAERIREHDRQRNRKGDQDREEYLQQARERRETACRLKSQGMPNKTIAEQMGLTVKQVENLLHYANRAGK